jgi:hypothetical protein
MGLGTIGGKRQLGRDAAAADAGIRVTHASYEYLYYVVLSAPATLAHPPSLCPFLTSS